MDSAGIDMTAARKAWDLGGGENVDKWQRSGRYLESPALPLLRGV